MPEQILHSDWSTLVQAFQEHVVRSISDSSLQHSVIVSVLRRCAETDWVPWSPPALFATLSHTCGVYFSSRLCSLGFFSSLHLSRCFCSSQQKHGRCEFRTKRRHPQSHLEARRQAGVCQQQGYWREARILSIRRNTWKQASLTSQGEVENMLMRSWFYPGQWCE